MLRSRRDPPPAQRACILDDTGIHYIEESYRILGVREGWLKWDGHTWDCMGNLVNIYRLRSPP